MRQCECDGASQSRHYMTMMTLIHEVSILTKVILLAQQPTMLKLKFLKNENDYTISFLFFSFSLVFVFIFSFSFFLLFAII